MGFGGRQVSQSCKPTWSSGIPLQKSHLNENCNNAHKSKEGNFSYKEKKINSKCLAMELINWDLKRTSQANCA